MTSTTKNIAYSEDCSLDLYYSETAAAADNKQAVIIVIHGGAWFLGDKLYVSDMAIPIVKKGFVVVTPSYHLSKFSNADIERMLVVEVIILLTLLALSRGSESAILIIFLIFSLLLMLTFTVSKPRQQIKHPTHATDIAQCVKWVHNNISQFGGDPDNIILMGHSAGGHLASIVSTNHRFLRSVGVDIGIIKATICLSGVFSDVRLQETKIGRRILRGAFGIERIDAFPIYHVNPLVPPHLLINASSDYSLEKHTLDYATILKQNGILVKTKIYQGHNHFTIKQNWDKDKDNILNDIIIFIQSVYIKSYS
jgi:acetyl esterase/lipase